MGAVCKERPTEDELDALKHIVLTKMRGMVAPGEQTAGDIDKHDMVVMLLDAAVAYIIQEINKDATQDPVALFDYILEMDACSQNDLWKIMKPLVRQIRQYMGKSAT